ncbi:hypothetical protein KVR01_012902 [Diaporthe batatas]|uniref:uncharacterized protein n=1 Tax=Diaporthe batatas TaxID=748121 RepID=UPI001D0595F2|nr:uncharacterized protein KVR01_012902 [Diaporthe batatas]KAG8157194.1 hypothetical protein KVR01_012902 [Diaporthe batatas]
MKRNPEFRGEPSSPKRWNYILGDVEVMLKCLSYIYNEEQQPDAARVYTAALKTPYTSPFAAFEKAAMASPRARQLDARHLGRGGLYHYLERRLELEGFDFERSSDDLRRDFGDAKAARKVREIKMLMAAGCAGDDAGPAETEAVAGQLGENEVKDGVKGEVKKQRRSKFTDPFPMRLDPIYEVEEEDEDKVKDRVKDKVKIKKKSKFQEALAIRLVIKDEVKDEVKDEPVN